ncbi:MAG: hypothetical protein HZB67_06295, partial [Candidatus Aenigmarchaeota archaeon]|nr:hypothetical protein [Candidatus Aenigmarchaeota archaeon]
MLENYSPETQSALKKLGADVGQRIAVQKGEERWEGLLMPKSAGDSNCIVLKLDSGYNVGVAFDNSVKIEKLKEATHTAGKKKKPKPKFDSNKPTIVIL